MLLEKLEKDINIFISRILLLEESDEGYEVARKNVETILNSGYCSEESKFAFMYFLDEYCKVFDSGYLPGRAEACTDEELESCCNVLLFICYMYYVCNIK